MNPIEIDIRKLRKELIKIYMKYLNESTNTETTKMARKLDGMWSGNSLLPRELEIAVDNLTAFYVEPYLTKENAKTILNNLKNNFEDPMNDIIKKITKNKFGIPHLIFFGDTHGFLNEFNIQKEIITTIEPEYILMEKLENIKLESESDYDRVLSKKSISEMTEVKEIKDMLKLCKQKRIKLVGIDFKNFGLNKKLRDLVLSQNKPSKLETKELENILSLREKHQSEMIKRFSKKSSGPLLIITGSWHLRQGSPLYEGIKSYGLVIPSVANKLIYEQTNKKIKYIAKIIAK